MKSLRATTAKTKNIWFLRGEPTGRCYFFFILEISDEDECSSTSDFFFTVHLKIQFSSLIILRFSIFQHKNTFFCGDARHWPFGDPSGTYTSFHFFILQLTFLIFFFYIFTIFLLIQFCTFLVLFSFFVIRFFCMHFPRHSWNESSPPSPSPPSPP